MSEKILTDIVSPGLTDSNYGDSIDKQFERINYNFEKLSNVDFMKGEKGDNTYVVEYTFNLGDHNAHPDGDFYINDELISPDIIYRKLFKAICGYELEQNVKMECYEPNVLNRGSHSVHNTNCKIKHKFNINGNKIYVSDQLQGKLKELQSVTVDGTIVDWYDFLNKYNKIVLIYSKDERTNKRHIISSLYYTFKDERFNSLRYENVDVYNNIKDLSCIVSLQFDNNAGYIFKRHDVFPTIYYNNDIKSGVYDYGTFCWTFNGVETEISAEGPRGLTGKTNQIYMVKAGVDDNLSNMGITGVDGKPANVTGYCTITHVYGYEKYDDNKHWDIRNEFITDPYSTTELKTRLGWIPVNDYVNYIESDPYYDRLSFDTGAPVLVIMDDYKTESIQVTKENNESFEYRPYRVWLSCLEKRQTNIVSDSAEYMYCAKCDTNNSIIGAIDTCHLKNSLMNISMKNDELSGLYVPMQSADYNSETNKYSQPGHLMIALPEIEEGSNSVDNAVKPKKHLCFAPMLDAIPGKTILNIGDSDFIKDCLASFLYKNVNFLANINVGLDVNVNGDINVGGNVNVDKCININMGDVEDSNDPRGLAVKKMVYNRQTGKDEIFDVVKLDELGVTIGNGGQLSVDGNITAANHSMEIGNVNVKNELNVNGDACINGELNVNQNTNINGELSVAKDIKLNGNLDLDGDQHINITHETRDTADSVNSVNINTKSISLKTIKLNENGERETSMIFEVNADGITQGLEDYDPNSNHPAVDGDNFYKAYFNEDVLFGDNIKAGAVDVEHLDVKTAEVVDHLKIGAGLEVPVMEASNIICNDNISVEKININSTFHHPKLVLNDNDTESVVNGDVRFEGGEVSFTNGINFGDNVIIHSDESLNMEWIKSNKPVTPTGKWHDITTKNTGLRNGGANLIGAGVSTSNLSKSFYELWNNPVLAIDSGEWVDGADVKTNENGNNNFVIDGYIGSVNLMSLEQDLSNQEYTMMKIDFNNDLCIPFTISCRNIRTEKMFGIPRWVYPHLGSINVKVQLWGSVYTSTGIHDIPLKVYYNSSNNPNQYPEYRHPLYTTNGSADGYIVDETIKYNKSIFADANKKFYDEDKLKNNNHGTTILNYVTINLPDSVYLDLHDNSGSGIFETHESLKDNKNPMALYRIYAKIYFKANVYRSEGHKEDTRSRKYFRSMKILGTLTYNNSLKYVFDKNFRASIELGSFKSTYGYGDAKLPLEYYTGNKQNMFDELILPKGSTSIFDIKNKVTYETNSIATVTGYKAGNADASPKAHIFKNGIGLISAGKNNGSIFICTSGLGAGKECPYIIVGDNPEGTEGVKYKGIKLIDLMTDDISI